MHAYLEKIAQVLHLPGKQSQLIVQEIKTHLQQEIQILVLSGMSQQQSEQRAIAEFGEPKVVAQRFNKIHQRWFNSVPRIVLGVIAALLLRQGLSVWLFSEVVAGGIAENVFSVLTQLNDVVEKITYIGLPYIIFHRLQTLQLSDKKIMAGIIIITISAVTISTPELFGGYLSQGIAVGVIFSVIFSALLLYQRFTERVVAE